MKKAIVLALAIILVLSITGCGSSQKKDVDSALQGTWYFDGGLFYREITFKKGSLNVDYNNAFGMPDSYGGSYEIDTKNEIIKTNSTDGWLDKRVLEYSYNDKSGVLTLWLDGSQGRKVD